MKNIRCYLQGLTLNGEGEINIGDTAERGSLFLPLFALLGGTATPPSGLGVAPHVGAAVCGWNIQESDALKRRPFAQIQWNAITDELDFLMEVLARGRKLLRRGIFEVPQFVLHTVVELLRVLLSLLVKL